MKRWEQLATITAACIIIAAAWFPLTRPLVILLLGAAAVGAVAVAFGALAGYMGR